jgi:histidinol-phosphatase (PHP family)
MSDYHLHLHPHHPEPGSPPMGEYPPGYVDQYVETALGRGCAEIGFTEHLYRCAESDQILGRWWEEDPNPLLAAEIAEIVRTERNLHLGRYVEVVLDAKQRGLPVKLGLEVDFQPGTEEKIIELLAPYPFDFLIGSVHWVGAWWPDRAEGLAEFARLGVRKSYEKYFAAEAMLAASGLVDVLAHADFVKRTGAHLEPAPVDLYAPVVAGAVATGTAVEVSSAGLRQAPKEVYPAPTFLQMFHDAGVPITMASDAHRPGDAAWGMSRVVAAARAAGYTRHIRFHARQRIYVPFPETEGAE